MDNPRELNDWEPGKGHKQTVRSFMVLSGRAHRRAVGEKLEGRPERSHTHGEPLALVPISLGSKDWNM